MKDFSIFEHALRLSIDNPLENLGEIASITRRNFDQTESFICRTTSASVEYACLMIENTLLLRTNRGGRVYAGFENLSCLRPIIDLYLRIADVSESVYLFGQPDWEPPRHPNIRLVNLSSDLRLAREWFVIAQSSTFNGALVALDEGGMETIPEQMRYWALKTTRGALVNQLTEAVEGVIDWTLAA